MCPCCRFCYQQPVSSSWWMFVRFVASSCSLSFTPPTVWALEPSLTCTHALSCSTRPMHTQVSFSMFKTTNPESSLPLCVYVWWWRYFYVTVSFTGPEICCSLVSFSTSNTHSDHDVFRDIVSDYWALMDVALFVCHRAYELKYAGCVVCNSACLCLLEQHFTEVVQGEEFLGLSLQQVCSLISSDKLTVSTEEKVRQHNTHTHTHSPLIKAVVTLS